MALKNNTLFFFVFFVSTLFFSCGDDDSNGNACSTDYDQVAMFTNIADNFIVPKYSELDQATQELEAEVKAFVETEQSLTQLEKVRSSFTTAYEKWQQVAMFQFGPAEDQSLRPLMNNFPLDVTAMENNVTSGDYDLTNPANFDHGFPALDYLLYAPGATDQEVLAAFTTDAGAENRRNYLKDVAAVIRERVELTWRGWTTEGYRDDFINNTGTDAGSALSLLINGLNEFYEDIRRDKIGTPSGIQDLGFTSPDKVEAVYSGHSLTLLRSALVACQDVFSGGTNAGLDDYLDALDARKESDLLSQLIKDRFASSIAALDGIDGTLSDAVDNDADDVRTAYTEISRQVIQLKTDMPSVMCVAITYVDNPSDSD